MKQKLKRFMAGFMAMLTLVGTLFTNGTTAFAASPQANIAFWNASVKNSGEVSELKPGYNHGKILYSILDGNSAYCMNFGLRADGGQLMNSYDDASTSMSAQQRKLLSYCLYYGFNSTQKAAPSNSQCDEYIATQAMVWVIVADIFGTGSGDSAARKLCNTAPSPDSSYSYYERLRDNISSSYNATLPSFASRRTSEAPTYELKWNEGSQRFETTLSDSNGVLSDFDFGISGYSVDKNGNSITISSTSVNTTAKDEWMVIENCHEPIITQELFDMAHANSKKCVRLKRGKRNYNPFYYCGVCGRALAPSKRVKGDILLCYSSRIEENSPCKNNRVEIAKVEDAIMKIVNMYATAYLDEKGIKKAGKSKEVSPEEKIATLEKKVKSLSSKKMMLYSDYKDDKLTREEYVKRSKAMVEQIDEWHQEIEQLKTEIPPEDNSSSKFETQLESIINMESFDREKIQKVIKKVIINGEDNIEIVWNTDDPFFK